MSASNVRPTNGEGSYKGYCELIFNYFEETVGNRLLSGNVNIAYGRDACFPRAKTRFALSHIELMKNMAIKRRKLQTILNENARLKENDFK